LKPPASQTDSRQARGEKDVTEEQKFAGFPKIERAKNNEKSGPAATLLVHESRKQI